MGVLGSIFGFGDSLKRRLRDAASNPSDYAMMTADQNQREWNRNPDERSMGFFNPVPLGTMGNFALRKELSDALPSLSRRDFMKKSAGIAGGTAAMSIPGAKLLSKFAPEEKQLVKEATAKQAAVESAPKYKYNSLKEYLDDVTAYADDAHADSFHSGYDPHSIEFKLNPEVAMDQAWIDANNIKSDMIKTRLLDDEAWYNRSKQELSKTPKDSPMYDVVESHTTTFSPQAKKEMKAFKELSVKHETPWEEAFPRMNDTGSWW